MNYECEDKADAEWMIQTLDGAFDRLKESAKHDAFQEVHRACYDRFSSMKINVQEKQMSAEQRRTEKAKLDGMSNLLDITDLFRS